ncbi:MAG: AAA family ATPase [Oscillospiraceae bacterium]|nr:AAA family ATPase [Oscillospiraceae bacterium]
MNGNDDISKLLALQRKLAREEEAKAEKTGRIFPVYTELPEHVRQLLRCAESDERLQSWASTVKALPRKTSAVPTAGKPMIQNAHKLWDEQVYGNSELFDVLLRHAVEYSRTGHTNAVLMVGPPGCGKTLAAEVYGSFLGLPTASWSASSVAGGSGWSGHGHVYVGAEPGIPVRSMVNTKCGNPVVCVNELEKAVQNTQHEYLLEAMLSSLDQDAVHWTDNFLGFPVDISHLIYCFTANDSERIPAPLLDRMEIVHLNALSKEDLKAITYRFTIPQAMDHFHCNDNEVIFRRELSEQLVDHLWKQGVTECRSIQRIVRKLISDAMIDHFLLERSVEIDETRIASLRERPGAGAGRSIGF